MGKISNYNVFDLHYVVEDGDDGFLNVTPREVFEKWNNAIFVLRDITIEDDRFIGASTDIVTAVFPSGEGYEMSTFGQSIFISDGIDSKFHVD